MKYLKLDPEYQCSPLWVSLDGEIYKNFEIDASPFDELLKNKIFNWAKNFEDTLNQDYPPDSGFKSVEEEEQFEQSGIDIWKDIVKSYSNLFNKVLFKSYRLQKLYSNLIEYQKDLKSKSIN
ncbi:MAG TPA: hypothetical protein VGQ04_01735 [Chitinophagaceae bacterium]|jgi:hypothetical protein|nr:hypothetical protein [Chitinophagaceae bacterium]